MRTLKPTVKRDLSLFSVLAWQQGYERYFVEKFGWRYPMYFWYDGQRVNFYHTVEDFTYFKETITQRLLDNDELFDRLNTQFQADIHTLKKITGQYYPRSLVEIFTLVGKIMSFYVFVVSDSFVNARPESWKSRHLPEGILYQFDEAIEHHLGDWLTSLRLPRMFAHVLSMHDIRSLMNRTPIDQEDLSARLESYIVERNTIYTSQTFQNFCSARDLVNPEFQSRTSPIELTGQVAYPGEISGPVRLVGSRNDLALVQPGDIFVTVMTNTTYLPAIKRAAAIVTDEGGITCHAAIMARELHKPCITGTKAATRVLKNGDQVQLDPKGRIRILSH